MEIRKMQDNTQNFKTSTKRKCINLCAADKLSILNRLSKGESVKALAIECNVTEKTIQYWSDNRDSIEKLIKDGGILQKKRLRKLPFANLDRAVYVWFHEMRLRGLPISGPIVKGKAVDLHAEMKIKEKFVASEGWLRNWKTRYNIRQIQITGEKISADPKAADDLKKKFPGIMEEKNVTLLQIFNFDEFGIFFRMLPSRTLAELSERQAPGFKGSKDRYTVGVCANVDGSCKLPLILIGKSKNPRALKNLSHSALPVYYTHQQSAWMNSEIFKTWFQEQFVQTVKDFLDKRGLPHRALLLLDNAPCHPDNETLKVGGIEVIFLPANTTSILQPMDQGIIATTKRIYRFKLLKAALSNQEKQIDVITFLKSINVKNVIYWISEAWDEVSSQTIFKCWKPLLTQKVAHHQDLNSFSAEKVNDENVTILLNSLKDYEKVAEEVVKEWIHKDDSKFCEMPTNAQIIEMVSEEVEKTTNAEDPDTEKENASILTVKPEEAVSAASILISFFQENSDIGIKTSELAVIQRAKEIILKNLDLNKKKSISNKAVI